MADGPGTGALGIAIGLGGKSKDLTGYLMQYQASNLKEKKAAAAQATKELKAEKDKVTERFTNFTPPDLHAKSVDRYQALYSDALEKTDKKLLEGDIEGARNVWVDFKNGFQDIKTRDASFKETETGVKSGTKRVPSDVAGYIADTNPDNYNYLNYKGGVKSADKLANLTPHLAAMGVVIDPNSGDIQAPGVPMMNIQDKLNVKLDPDAIYKQGGKPTTQTVTIQTPTGYQNIVKTLYTPTKEMYQSRLNEELNNPVMLQNEAIKLYDKLGTDEYLAAAEKKQAELEAQSQANAATNGGQVVMPTAADVQKALVIDDYMATGYDSWANFQTQGESASAKPTASAGSKAGKTETTPSTASTSKNAHLTPAFRAALVTINPSAADLSDTEIFEEIKANPTGDLAKSFSENQARWQKKAPGVPIQNDYHTMKFAINPTELFKEGKKVINPTEMWYDPATKKFYGSFAAIDSFGGMSTSTKQTTAEITPEEMKTYKIAGVNVKQIKQNFSDWDANARANGTPTIDEYITGVKSTATASSSQKNNNNRTSTSSEKITKNQLLAMAPAKRALYSKNSDGTYSKK